MLFFLVLPSRNPFFWFSDIYFLFTIITQLLQVIFLFDFPALKLMSKSAAKRFLLHCGHEKDQSVPPNSQTHCVCILGNIAYFWEAFGHLTSRWILLECFTQDGISSSHLSVRFGYSGTSTYLRLLKYCCYIYG